LVGHAERKRKNQGVDAMRLYYVHVGSPFVDIEWDAEAVLKYKKRIANIWKVMQQLSDKKGGENKNLDNWLLSTINRRIQNITNAFESFDLRVASNEIFFECHKDIQWYLRRGGGNKKLLDRFVKTWIALMTPITPHLSEELWHLKEDTLVSTAPYPKVNLKEISEEDEVGEYLLSKVVDDVSEILKVTKMTPKKIHIYTSPAWKRDTFRKSIELDAEHKFNVGSMMKDLMADPKMKPLAKQVSQFVGKLAGEVKKLGETDKKRYLTNLDEKKYLENAKEYLKDVFSCDITIASSDNKDLYDPANKVRYAAPLRPAIYVE